MSKKKGDAPGPFGPFSMEKMMRNLTKLLEQQDFENEEEANAFLQQFMGKPLPDMDFGDSDNPLSRAQELVYEAREAESREQAARLAHRALKLSDDCADAYVLLAETEAESVKQAHDYYAQGVEAGKRALGPEVFDEDAGHFWGILETRPFMRALQGLAETEWLLGHRETAIEHYQEMLRLNPNDNQGVRYELSDCLMTLDRQDELDALLNEYDDDIAARWLYHRALLRFRQDGETDEANALLTEALEQNPRVPAFLTGRRKLPRRMPEYMSFGDETEAVDYARKGFAHWRDTYGALRWLRHAAKRSR